MTSSTKVNSNTSIVCNYNSDTFSYLPAGKSGLLKASEYLRTCQCYRRSQWACECKKFDHESVVGFEGYRQYYHSGQDLHNNIESTSANNDSESANDSFDERPFIVEKIVAKRYTF